jgi:hypothetical protein
MGAIFDAWIDHEALRSMIRRGKTDEEIARYFIGEHYGPEHLAAIRSARSHRSGEKGRPRKFG